MRSNSERKNSENRHVCCRGNSATEQSIESGLYTCPMHPEVKQPEPGNCPRCGMSLELIAGSAPGLAVEYVCPIHLEIVKNIPGNCPLCGMALEPRDMTIDDENPEFGDMTYRFRVSILFALPVFILAMLHDLAPGLSSEIARLKTFQWIEFSLATPVVLWCGLPFFQRGWTSIIHRNLNMFTLIALRVNRG